MTQNKKFKKLVRARMAETGETYMQARRAMGGDDRERPPKLRRLGYWRSTEEPHLPDPIDLVDASWGAAERTRVLAHLSGAPVIARYMGFSWCRLGCGQEPDRPKRFFDAAGTTDGSATWEERRRRRLEAARKAEEAQVPERIFDKDEMGSGERTDGVYVWPEGLVHYLEKHNVRLPQEFVDHVLSDPEIGEAPVKYEAYEADESWWLRETNLRKLLTTPSVLEKMDELRKTLRFMWHEIYAGGNSFGYHVYADGPEDGRAHTSLCGAATTRTWETKTPGGPHCETCQLLKVQAILEGQKIPGSPLAILHDADLWAASGGAEKDRVALRDEMWGEPPGHKVQGARLLEIETPFNPGWYFHDTEYPDEGSVGPYKLREDAVQAARLAEYDVDDPDAVTFWEQRKPGAVLQRFTVEHLRNELLTTLQEFKVEERVHDVAGRFQELLAERLRAAVKKLEAQGVKAPPEEDFGMEITSEGGADQGVMAGRIWLRHPERYPHLVSDLTDAGIIEPRYLVSVEFKEAE
jgi:hypothetical protein